MVNLNRRQTLALGGATFLSELLLGGAMASAQASDKLTIAYNVNLPSFDPTVGPSAVNPTIQAIYRVDLRSVCRAEPGSLVRAWPPDQMGLERRQDQGVDGCARRGRLARRFAAYAEPMSYGRWSAPAIRRPATRFSSSGAVSAIIRSRVIASPPTSSSSIPTVFKWMAFLTGYILPKAYYEKVGAEGFEKKPVGAGPYMVDEYQGNAFLRLKAK